MALTETIKEILRKGGMETKKVGHLVTIGTGCICLLPVFWRGYSWPWVGALAVVLAAGTGGYLKGKQIAASFSDGAQPPHDESGAPQEGKC